MCVSAMGVRCVLIVVARALSRGGAVFGGFVWEGGSAVMLFVAL